MNAETGPSCAYDDHQRMKEIISTWVKSPKGLQAAMDAMPPEARQAMNSMMGAMGGDMENMMQ